MWDIKSKDTAGRTAEDFLKQDAKRKLAPLAQPVIRGSAKDKPHGP
ncbi:hypothetical protein PTKU46_83710 [Paraburkholderia terrae]